MSAKSKVDHERLLVRLGDIYPSAENAELYRPVTPDDPETIALADSIKEHGIREPIVISEDFYILSGHRRHVAARMAGLEKVPCRVERGVWHDGPKADGTFLKRLREYNRQRIKNRDE